MHWWDGGWRMGIMWIWWLLAVVLVVGSVWLLARAGSGRGSRRESPEETLKRRYANGEIDREEYERRLADLR